MSNDERPAADKPVAFRPWADQIERLEAATVLETGKRGELTSQTTIIREALDLWFEHHLHEEELRRFRAKRAPKKTPLAGASGEHYPRPKGRYHRSDGPRGLTQTPTPYSLNPAA